MAGRSQRLAQGGALLAVLWLSAALAAIVFSVATAVRSETDRTSTSLDGARASLLAKGAIERALVYMEWALRFRNPDGTPRYFDPYQRRLTFEFPAGFAEVEVIPETAKLNLNTASAEDLFRLLLALGLDWSHAQLTAAAIVDWRSRPAEGPVTEFDRYYLSLIPSFRSPHASFQEVEELLLVRGVTADLFYGRVDRDALGHPVYRLGLRDCLSIYGGSPAVDANSAPPPVLAAVGLSEPEIASLVAARSLSPLRTPQQLLDAGVRPELIGRLTVTPGRVFTLRASARLRTPAGAAGDLKRTVGALIYFGETTREGFPVLRWYEWM